MECAYVVDETYHTKANQLYDDGDVPGIAPAKDALRAIETLLRQPRFRSMCGGSWRLRQYSETRGKVIKPRIGMDGRQTDSAGREMYPAFVTWMTGKPAKMVFTREESMIASSPRHEMEARSDRGG